MRIVAKLLCLGVAGCLFTGIVNARPVDGGPCQLIVNLNGGPIVGTWSLANSPVCVTTNIQIGSLVIDAGVCVLASPGVQISVIGTLDVNGLGGQPVTFGALDPAQGWNGFLLVSNGSNSSFVNCIVRNSVSRGFTLIDSTPEMRNCVIEANTALANGAGLHADLGAGLVLVMNGCTIAGNTSNPTLSGGNYRGGGLDIIGSCELINCIVRGNKVYSRCSSMFCDASALGGGARISGESVIRNCVFESNLADNRTSCNGASSSLAYGGGLYYAGAGPHRLLNTIVSCNTTTAACGVGTGGSDGNHALGSGIYVASGDLEIVNSTIVNNNNHGVRRSGGTVSLRNSIVFFNGSSELSGTLSADYCNIQGSPVYPGMSNINTNPAFLGTGCGSCDMRVGFFSPCVDAGDPDPIYADTCFPSSHGTPLNDIGAHGGPDSCDWGVGSAPYGFCQTAPNSVDAVGALISNGGSTSYSANDLVLFAAPIAAGQPAIFYYGGSELNTTFGNGFRCVGGQTYRLPVVFADGAGVLMYAIDNSVPEVSNHFLPGCTQKFQAWYRDPAAGGASFNLSNGLSLTFMP